MVWRFLGFVLVSACVALRFNCHDGDSNDIHRRRFILYWVAAGAVLVVLYYSKTKYLEKESERDREREREG